MISPTNGPGKLNIEFIQQLEQIESHYWMKYYRGDTILPSYSSIMAGGMAYAVPDIEILAMNRVIGLGAISAIDDSVLRQIIHFYEDVGSSRFFIQLPPVFASTEVQNMLFHHGFTHHNNWTKLYRKVEPLRISTNEELTVRKIDKKESDSYGQLIFMSFDWEDTRLASWLAATVGQEGYRNYIVSWKGIDIAAGALFVKGKMASMAFAGTLKSFRGKGAQRLLLKTRMQDAFDMGAQFISSETAEHKAVKPVRSYLNLEKCGFETAYQRQNWIYQFGD